MLSKVTKKVKNDQVERYIKDEVNNSETTIGKKSRIRRKLDLKYRYKRLRVNKELLKNNLS